MGGKASRRLGGGQGYDGGAPLKGVLFVRTGARNACICGRRFVFSSVLIIFVCRGTDECVFTCKCHTFALESQRERCTYACASVALSLLIDVHVCVSFVRGRRASVSSACSNRCQRYMQHVAQVTSRLFRHTSQIRLPFCVFSYACVHRCVSNPGSIRVLTCIFFDAKHHNYLYHPVALTCPSTSTPFATQKSEFVGGKRVMIFHLDPEGASALALAAMGGHTALVELLLG